MSRAPAVICDSCILFPPSLRDLFVWLGITGACRPRWTAAIHEEWTRSVLAARTNVSAESLARCRSLMDAAVPDCLVNGYEALIPSLTLPDPDDRHVLAAAIHAGVENIVTFNLRDFPEEQTRPHGVIAIPPDDFLVRLLDGFEDEVCRAVQSQRALLKNPPKTTAQHLATLEKIGLMQAASLLRAHDARL
ncbi:PIN domain-containing protein [Aquisphaera insulae]|uniref:PIN domain-containing protein n=1 Tax=Aquisphaera insulae TaxID=2712864 RepID=UPI0013EE3A6A|nr:PIN domain-containing protein [Aquisphaera insulae]